MSEKENIAVVEEAAEETLAEEVIERQYTLRKLKDSDLFPVLNILRLVGLKEFKDAFSQVVGGLNANEIGLNVVLEMASIVISNMPKAEKEIYDFCSAISGIEVADIKEMEFGTVPLMIYDAFGSAKNTSFFKVLSKLL